MNDDTLRPLLQERPRARPLCDRCTYCTQHALNSGWRRSFRAVR